MEAYDTNEFPAALTLETPGGPATFSLDLFNVFLTDATEDGVPPAPEAFELEGESVMIAGEIAPEHRIGYASDWKRVLDVPLAVRRVGGEHGQHTSSEIDLPGRGPCSITGGELRVQSAGPVWGARAPLEGTCTLHVDTPEGLQTFHGTFSVLGATWG